MLCLQHVIIKVLNFSRIILIIEAIEYGIQWMGG